MDLSTAAQKHAEWKTKLRSAISKHEQMDVATLSRDDGCELGQWLHGEAKVRFCRLSAHSDCVHKHLAFHADVAKTPGAIPTQKTCSMPQRRMPRRQAFKRLSVFFLHLRKEAGI